MELVIYNPTADNAIKNIEWNFEELKQEVTERANDYKSLVYTDDTIKDAKKDRAALNKFSKALEDKRKEVKKMMLEPYTQFESQVKELVAIIGDANMNIDSQVKEYEQRKREEKRQKVQEIYDEVFGDSDLLSVITWDKAFKESYLNASVTLKSVRTEMTELLERVTNDLKIIDADMGEYQFEMKEAYLKNFNMTEALSVKQQFEETARRKAEYEARRKAEQEERAARERAEAERIANAGVKQEQRIPVSATETCTPSVEQTEEVITIAFKVTGTMEQINGLKKYLIDNKITYGPVEQ